MPFPINLEALLAAGYEYSHVEKCSVCGLEVEVYTTPGKRTIAMEPMPSYESQAVRHYERCAQLPAAKDLLLKAGYKFLDRPACAVCKRAVERYESPSGVILILNPMMGDDWPVMHHKCNIAVAKERSSGNLQDATGRIRNSGDDGGLVSPKTGLARVHDTGQKGTLHAERSALLSDGRCDAGGPQIQLHGVNDPNHQLIAVGWDDGKLVCQFKTAKWSYAGVPEAEFLKLRRVPYAYSIFTKNIKGKYPGMKME